MATEYERLAVLLEARVADFEKKIASATRNADRNFKKIEKSAEGMRDRMGKAAGAAAASFAGAFAAGAAIKAAVQLMDASKRIENSLKTAGLSGQQLTAVYEQLFASAQKNAAPVESLTTLYSKLSLTQNELGVGQAELIGFTDKIAMALRAGGTSATEASGALLQLSQALGGGIVRAEEFNSVLEGAPTIAQAAAAGLKEAGGSVAKLRQLVVDGKVSSQAFFRAFDVGAATLEGRLASAQSTTANNFVRLQNVMVDTAGKIDKATGSSAKLGAGINELAGIVQDFGRVVVNVAESDFGKFVGWITDGVGQVNELKRALGGLPGVFDKISKLQNDAFLRRPIGSSLQQDNIQNRINAAFEETALPKIPKGGRLPAAPKVDPVSIDDYKVTATKSKSGSNSKRENEYQREIEQIRERTASLTTAYAAQAALNPLVDDYGFAVEKAAAKQDLINAAQKAGKEVTPALAAEIDAAAEAYARAGSAAEQLAEKQNEIRESAQQALDTAKDVTRGMVDGFLEGEKAADIFANSLKKVGNALLDDIFNNMFKIQGLGGGGGGLLSGLFSLFGGGGSNYFPPAPSGGGFPYADGGYTGDGGKYQPAGVVHKGEYVFDKAAVAAAGGPAAMEAMRRGLKGYANGGAVGVSVPSLPSMRPANSNAAPVINYAPVIDARGASVEAVERLERVMQKQQNELQGRIEAGVRSAQKRNVKLG
ncbi:tape measure protein [Agrobacterium rosae]|uniref:tape measure protein n=1 Tax=Agrobacterium rosae TaxID=1972867 RepID=UPI0019D37A95|nr:tape measure protein [Agrobacterium rosae]MBN7807260.1 tape measure protein [Agrobacterium rosae]